MAKPRPEKKRTQKAKANGQLPLPTTRPAPSPSSTRILPMALRIDDRLVGEISVELLASLVTHYLVGHDLVRQFDAAIIPAKAELRPARPLVTLTAPARAVHDRDYRAELRARRRARKQNGAPGLCAEHVLNAASQRAKTRYLLRRLSATVPRK